MTAIHYIIIAGVVLLTGVIIIILIKKNKKGNKPAKLREKSGIGQGLHRTKELFGTRILNAFHLRKSLDDFYDKLEEALVTGDVSIETTLEILDNFKEKVEQEDLQDEEALKKQFKNVLTEMIPDKKFKLDDERMNVIFVFGVNGVGKTTSIAKLANLFKNNGKRVLISACDTFRAAASKQLAKWAYSIDVQIVKHAEGGSPGAVLYDAIDAAKARNIDVLIVDTAGRFHNRQNLMKELEKLNKIIANKIPDCKKQNLIVLDAGTGHNAFIQAQEFQQSVEVDGIILAKLDSTAKGGIVLPISHKLKIPIFFAGIGEKAEDLIRFNSEGFVNSLF